MSSLVSARRLHGPDGLPALRAAAVQVAEESLFAYAEPCDRARFDELVRGPAGGGRWLKATVGFSGPFDGAALIALPAGLAIDLAAAFSGQAADALSDADIDDFTGELANMICGLWLTRTHPADRFALAPPSVAAIASAAIAESPDDAAGSFLAIGNAPLLVALTAAGAVPGA